MSQYTPDRWVVLEFDYDGDVIKKVFAGWYGGYTQGDSWKLSSGVVAEREFDDRFEFDNHSGSLYVCYKNSYGFSGYMTDIFRQFTKDVDKSVGKEYEVTMKILHDYEKKVH